MLPLLAKELAEQSARPRTYIVRTLYATVFYAASLWGFYQQVGGRWSSDALTMLGTGRILFEQVVWSQLFATYVVLPALMAGVITGEKERDTLGLLLITRLSPWTIVSEKFLSRVLPMLLFLSLSLPLLGVAYSLGGVESQQVWMAILLLVSVVLQVGALGVLCSTWFRTTAQSLVATYLGSIPSLGLMGAYLNELLYPAVMTAGVAGRPVTMTLSVTWIAAMFQLVVLGLLPAFMGLALARGLLWERAFLRPQQWFLRLLQELDQWFHKLNQNSVTQGIVLLDDRQPLPDMAPISWKETQKRSMGTLRYLTRLLIAIEVPLLFLIILPLSDNLAWDRGFRLLDIAAMLVWWIAVFAILASSTGLISGERSRQTLDVLLSTPMSAKQIVQEKFAGVRRLIWVLWIPLGTVLGFRCWWMSQVATPWQRSDELLNLLRSVGGPLIYLPLIGWIGVHASLRFRSQIAAMTASLLLVLGAALVPWAISLVTPDRISTWDWEDSRTLALMALFPWTSDEMPRRTLLFGQVYAMHGYVYTLLHFALYASMWWWLRQRAARDLSLLSGRCERGDVRGTEGV